MPLSAHPADLELLFAEYDNEFFDGQIKKMLGTISLHFGLSKRMTRSGGKTACYTDRTSGRRRYEICVSTTVLFGCFDGEDHRPITASGIICRDRLDALQRVMEHELVHLIEMLLWDMSSCSQSRFHSITRRFFGHTENMHRLITPQEKAMVKFAVQPGMVVRFRFDCVEHKGVVNRINKRATVLVEDSASAENSMFDRSSEKLYRVKERLEELVAELDTLIQEARGISDTGLAQNGAADDSDLVRQIAEQREVLAAVVDVIGQATANMPPSDW